MLQILAVPTRSPVQTKTQRCIDIDLILSVMEMSAPPLARPPVATPFAFPYSSRRYPGSIKRSKLRHRVQLFQRIGNRLLRYLSGMIMFQNSTGTSSMINKRFAANPSAPNERDSGCPYTYFSTICHKTSFSNPAPYLDVPNRAVRLRIESEGCRCFSIVGRIKVIKLDWFCRFFGLDFDSEGLD